MGKGEKVISKDDETTGEFQLSLIPWETLECKVLQKLFHLEARWWAICTPGSVSRWPLAAPRGRGGK